MYLPNGKKMIALFRKVLLNNLNAITTKLLLYKGSKIDNKTDNEVQPRGVCSGGYDYDAAPQEATITF